MTFWAVFEHFSYNKIEMNPLSSSTNLERLLGEYEPLHVLILQGDFRVSKGSKNWSK